MDYIRSRVDLGVHLWWESIDRRFKFLFDLHNILLIAFGYQVYSQADLSEPAAPANSVQVGL